jgi:hypothetical protein
VDGIAVVVAGARFGAKGDVCVPGTAVCGVVPDAFEAFMGLEL